MPLTDHAVTAINDAVFLGGSPTFPSGLWLAFYTDTACTTECSGGSYARVSVTLTGAGRAVSNSVAASVVVGGSDTAVAWGLVDASTGGNLWAYGLLPVPQTAGTVPIAVGALTVTG